MECREHGYHTQPMFGHLDLVGVAPAVDTSHYGTREVYRKYGKKNYIKLQNRVSKEPYKSEQG